jgi:hypothetical protein
LGKHSYVTKTFASNQIGLDHKPVKDVSITQADTTFIAGTDYSVDSVMGVITRLPNGNLENNATVTISYTYATPPEPITADAF